MRIAFDVNFCQQKQGFAQQAEAREQSLFSFVGAAVSLRHRL